MDILKIYTRVHSGEKPFTCHQSTKSFSVLGNLQNHSRVTLEWKLIAVFFCKKSFSQKCYLQGHEKLHTGEKQESCSFCNKSFLQKCNLRNHLKWHTGEKSMLNYFYKIIQHIVLLNYVLISWCPYLFSCLSIENLWRTPNSGRTYSIVIQKHLNLIGNIYYF